MYNRILKRPMFKRGGPSYQAQGTGITSGLDKPRRGLVQHPGGYAGDTREIIATEREEIFAPKPYENVNDIISSFGVYANPKHEDGSYKTTGEMGWDQAQMIDKIRKEREDKRKLAELSGYERELKNIDLKKAQDFELKTIDLDQQGEMALAKYDRGTQLQIAELAKQNTATGIKLKTNDDILADEIAAANDIVHPAEKAAAIKAARERHKKQQLEIISGSNLMAQAQKIAAAMAGDSMKSAEDIITDVLIIIKGLEAALAKGGRVGYQMGTPDTGAMPMEPVQASVTETIDTPGEDMTMTDTVTEGPQSTVQMPYEEFRAAIPAEVNDDIVQLIYYNQDAFADFAQISTQADVYAFNNKYGVSLVLPMDTETT